MKYFTHTKGTQPVLQHIPHSSLSIPQEFQKDFVLPDAALKQEAQWMADLYTDELFHDSSGDWYTLQSDISRLVVDVERFEDEAQEEMSRYGMAAVYTKTSTGETLKTVSNERKEEYLSAVFRPYHTQLNALVAECIAQHGLCVIVDCHSFPSESRYYEDQTPNRPDICLGTSTAYTPDWLFETLQSHFRNAGLSVEVNTPFSGTILPNDLLSQKQYEGKIFSIMIEVNRKLYMDEHSFEKSSQFEKTTMLMKQALELVKKKAISQEADRL